MPTFVIKEKNRSVECKKFKNLDRKLKQACDLATIIKQVKRFETINRASLTRSQKFLLQHQSEYCVHVDDQTESSDNLMNMYDPLKKTVTKENMERNLNALVGSRLDDFDRKLLDGVLTPPKSDKNNSTDGKGD